MADVDYPQRLREIAESNSDLYSEERDVLLEAAWLLKRLMPRDMTLEQAAEIERMKTSETCSCSHCVMCGAPKAAAKEAANG